MTRTPHVLIVDDEPSVRLTLEEALRPLEVEVSAAASGEDALAVLRTRPVDVMLLDLRLPRLGGMDLLRHLEWAHPEVRVVVVTAHGTVADAVEAMKHGAADFLQKPFAIAEVRALVRRVLDRERLDATRATEYDEHVELARRHVNERTFAAAREHARLAIGLDHRRPEAFNLLGVLEEIAGRRDAALVQYRLALAADPGYRAAQDNLRRATSSPSERRGVPRVD
jgi:DNA-binding NtrC family response regulator